MKKFELNFPVEHDGSVVRAVLVRAPTAEDFAAAAPGWRVGCASPPEDLPGAIHRMIERVTDLPADLVLELDCLDIMMLGDVLGELGRKAMEKEK